MSKTYRPPYRIYRTLFLLLVLAAIALNGICFYLSYEYAEERDGAGSEADYMIVVRKARDLLESETDYRTSLNAFYNSIFSQVTEAEPIRLSMPAAYHEEILTVMSQDTTEAEIGLRTLAVYEVTCEEVIFVWHDEGVPSYGPDGSATFYEYRVSAVDSPHLPAEGKKYTELRIRSLLNYDNDAPIMEVGKRYLVWGSTYENEDGSITMSLTNSDLSFTKAVRVSGETILYQETGTMPAISEIADSVDVFLETENGKLWTERVFPIVAVSHNTIRVIGTPSCGVLYSFDTGEVTLTEGRTLTQEDHEAKNHVCMVSEELARVNGWSVGDVVPLSFYQTSYKDNLASPYPGYFDPYRGFREEGEYWIVGIYHTENRAGNSYGVHPDTVILPQSALKYSYYQRLPAAMYYAVLPENLDVFSAELKDLLVYERFHIPAEDKPASPERVEDTAEVGQPMYQKVWHLGNAVLIACAALLILVPLIRYFIDHRRTIGIYIREIAVYVIKRLIREPLSGLFSCLLVVTVAFLLMIMQSRLDRQAAELENTYDQYPVLCTVSDATGAQTERLKIPPSIYRRCMEKDGRLYPYIKDLTLRIEMNYLAASMIGGVPLAGNTSDEVPTQTVYGINRLAAEARFSADAVTFREGYSEESLKGDNLVCLIPQGEGEMPAAVTFYLQKNKYVRLTVIGTYASSQTDAIYCPFLTVCNWITESGGIPYADSMYFLVADNRELNACKKELSRYFIEASQSISPDMLSEQAIIIDDALFTESVYVLERGILMFRITAAVLCVLSIGVSFLAAFLAIRGRRTEFAVMCSLGKARAAVYMTALTEHLVFYAVGILLTLLLYLAVFGILPSLLYLLMFLLCYVAGVSIAICQATWGKIMHVLKGNE